VQTLAHSLAIEPSTICRYLTEVLGMKCRNLWWVSHTLTLLQQRLIVNSCESRSKGEQNTNTPNFLFCFLLPLRCDPIFTIIVNGTDDWKIVILPKRHKMNNMFFIKCFLGPLAELCYPQGRKSRERRVMVHFDNAPIHNTEEVQGYCANVEFRRMKHALYRPDLAPCDFFLLRQSKRISLDIVLIVLMTI
jgi:hypothetical protein